MTLYQLASRFVGEIQERPGTADHPFILWCLEAVQIVGAHDEVKWCSAFPSRLCWMLRLPRSKSAAARSWLGIGEAIDLGQARAENDVVILQRGDGFQPGPDVLDAPGHVIVFAGLDGDFVRGVGGNQQNGVTVGRFPIARVLGVRRLA